MKAKTEGGREMKATVSAIQEKTEAVINSIQCELDESIKYQVEAVLASVNNHTQGLCEKLNVKIEEMQLGLQVVTMSFNARTWGLHENEQKD
jgi:hypothetical protein